MIPYEEPPRLQNAKGATRSIGVEMEFSDLDAQAAAHVLRDGLGGEVRACDPNAFAVEGTSLGDLTVKLDTRYGHGEEGEGSLSDSLQAELGNLFVSIADPLIPRELVTGPISMSELHRIDEATALLRKAGAGGTDGGGPAVLALHLNPEPPDLEPETIAATLLSFGLLNAWLRQKSDPARLRRMLGYFSMYPATYVRMLADPGYRPDMGTLIDDYIAANPTRDRDLDALPLLLFIDESRVRAKLPDEKIGRRPTFHYRLPDSRVGDPRWSVAVAWNGWIAVERLAADSERLNELARIYRSFDGNAESWAETAGSFVAS